VAYRKNGLRFADIFVFWLPLFGTWIMMSAEGPFLACVIARLENPKYNLAAYGVAYCLALIFESPIIMIMSASTALVKDRYSFLKLRSFTYCLNGIISMAMLFTLAPAVFRLIMGRLVGLPNDILGMTHVASLILLPWPAAIGYRRFYQGILIRSDLTRRVAYGTVIRLSSMALTALFLYFFFEIKGVYVGAAALSVGVLMEATASRIMAKEIVGELFYKDSLNLSKQVLVNNKYLIKFYMPLALTSILSLGIHPIVTFFMGKSTFAMESLAVLPVLSSLIMIFNSFGFSIQEVGIALIGKHSENLRKIRNFALGLGVFSSVGLSAIAFTPLASFWFHDVSGLSLELSSFATLPIRIMSIIPFLTATLCFQRSVLVNARTTKLIPKATTLEVTAIILLLITVIHYFNIAGAIGAAMSLSAGITCSNIYLFTHAFKTPKTKATRLC